jgi:NitT/TauT family transport system ATP-binding protein
MKLATGLRMPSKGTILIDGREVTGPLKITGMAFQSSSLLPWRTTLDNVLLPLEIVEPYRSSFRARRDEYAAEGEPALQSVGLGGYEHKFPWELSGGMQQRASICRALIHEPKMLLLDEPFGALDAFTARSCGASLRDLWSAQRFKRQSSSRTTCARRCSSQTRLYVMSRKPRPDAGAREIGPAPGRARSRSRTR